MYTIYTHINKINCKVYIGQTKNKVSNRWGNNGKNYLRYTTIFSQAIKKYGWNNFIHAIVREGLTKIEADCIERYLIAYYKGLDACYNMTDGGEGRVGVRFPDRLKPLVSARFKGKPLTEEHKAKISKALTGIKRSESFREKLRHRAPIGAKRVQKLDMSGNLICEYMSTKEASRNTGIQATHIARCARGARPSAGGFIWKYV